MIPRIRLHRSLLTRLMLVVVVALLPALVLQAYSEREASQLRHANARAEALRVLSLVSATQQEISQGARQLLTAVVQTRLARSSGHDLNACQTYLRSVLRSVDRYSALLVTDAAGTITCTGNLREPGNSVATRTYWLRAMETGEFSTGDFVHGRFKGLPELHFAMPLRTAEGELLGVAAVGLNLTWLQERIDTIRLAPGTAITIADREGTILARSPRGGPAIGEHADVATPQLLDDDADGVVEYDEPGGGGHILAYSPLAVAPRDLWIGVTSDASSPIADVARADQWGVLMLVLGGLLALLLTVLGTRLAIARPTGRLLGAAAAWQRGQMSARTGLGPDGSEFGRLGVAFDQMASALEEREAALNQALESTTDNVFTLDHAFRFTWLNQHARAQLQLEGAAALEGQVIWEAFPDIVGSAYEMAYRDARATGSPQSLELFYAPLGATFATQIYPSERGLTVFYRDVTMVRRAEQALAESQARLAGIAETIPGLVFVTDAAGRTVFVNRRTLDFTGIPAAALEAHGLAAAVHDEERARLTGCFEAGIACEIEVRLRRADGAYVWHLIRGLPWFDEDRQVREWYGVATDIDAIVAARAALARAGAMLEQEVDRRTAALAESEARLRAIFDNVPDLVLLLSVPPLGQSRLDAANPAAARFLGEDATSLAGAPLDRLPGLRPLLGLLRSCAGNGHEERAELELPAGDGKLIAEILLVPLPGARVLATMRDITERRALQAQLAQAQKMEAVGQLTGGVAHDFNNLLQSMVSALELVRRHLAGQHPSAERLLDTALRAAARGGRLTRQLLAFSRKQTLAPEIVDIGKLVLDIAELLGRAAGETVTLRLEPPGQSLTCRVDPVQLESALLNLTLNARDAMPNGGTLVVSARAVRLDAGQAARLDLTRGAYVRLDVADSGIGIPPEVLSHLFEPFFTTKEVGRGSGLGLAMVHGFLRQSGGAVSVDSVPGQGAVFSLYLPREGAEARALRLASPRAEPDDAAAASVTGTILLVEDDVAVLATSTELLEGAGHRVITAQDGPSALAIAREAGRIDLLLSDVVLPGGISGPEIAQRLQQLRPGLAVLLTSGYPRDMLDRHGLDGAVRLLLKPASSAQLLAAVAALLSPEHIAGSYD